MTPSATKLPGELQAPNDWLIANGWSHYPRSVASDYDHLWQKAHPELLGYDGVPLIINIKAYDLTNRMRVVVTPDNWSMTISISAVPSDDVWTEVVVHNVWASELVRVLDSQIKKLTRAWVAINAEEN